MRLRDLHRLFKVKLYKTSENFLHFKLSTHLAKSLASCSVTF